MAEYTSGTEAGAVNTKPVLLLRLEGPLQAWGSRARWDVRDTETEPTKSGVIGLLGCALGCRRGDKRLEELDSALRFGVRVESPGRVRSDYQTVTGFLPKAEGGFRFRGGTSAKVYDDTRPDLYGDLVPATIVSPRFYLEDAAFLVGLEQRDGGNSVLVQCAASLQDPLWPIFLGRRCCTPSRPIYDPISDGLRSDYVGLENALARHPWSWLKSGARLRGSNLAPKSLSVFVEDEDGDLIRQDAVRINAARVYGFRQVRRTSVTPVIKEDA